MLRTSSGLAPSRSTNDIVLVSQLPFGIVWIVNRCPPAGLAIAERLAVNLNR